MKESLSSSEWTLLALFFVFIASLIGIAKVNVYRAQDRIGKIANEKTEVIITISGAVKKPGDYLVPVGITLEKALKKSRPTPYADLKGVPIKKIIESPLCVNIEELKEVRVGVSGAVLEVVEVVMPVGSRICDLKSKIDFTNDTDKSYFRSRKLLRDGDKIVVPKKTVERN